MRPSSRPSAWPTAISTSSSPSSTSTKPHRMPRSPLRIAYFAHSLRSDWNNGNAHFLRGLLDNVRLLGHEITCFEPEHEWSIDNLRAEPQGEDSLAQFTEF